MSSTSSFLKSVSTILKNVFTPSYFIILSKQKSYQFIRQNINLSCSYTLPQQKLINYSYWCSLKAFYKFSLHTSEGLPSGEADLFMLLEHPPLHSTRVVVRLPWQRHRKKNAHNQTANQIISGNIFYALSSN